MQELINCNNATEYINMYIDNMLSDTERDQLMQHISSCAHCKKVLGDAIALKSALFGLGDVDPPAGLAATAIQKARKRRVPPFAYISGAVAAVVIAVAVIATSVLPRAGAPMEAQRLDDTVAFTEAADSAKMSGTYDMAADSAPMAAADEAADMECAEAPMDMDGGANVAKDDAAGAPDGVAAADGVAEDAAMDICLIYIAPDNAGFGQAIYTFVTQAGIQTEHIETGGGSVMSFDIDGEHFEAFESMLMEEEIVYEGSLYPGCRVEITFYE